ncbi:bifunctional diguanylate cyclase/phosphodiesterase [Phytohabitans sp. ZYX-F-186]|uniref:Bifunctional diguanylate cyclase/phosphodiesterase n=1 Tax=Phytohabitans maris TaxID=3071409 RepID=A0ABU0ZFJ7_9ACTN|nr:bifunctional diguanylate cyclase/phosphodiesterase [Phytohabitans sp. ZYX-F-186]MDQ7905834.1 bifunctional diguanylate cyclase/phosphodiesterase [Phytohabitans sp. ZYX-F-186]
MSHERGGQRPGLAVFARAWAKAVTGTSYLPVTPAQLEGFLEGLTVRLVEALYAEPFSLRRGYQIGADLVAAHIASAEGLGRTIEVIELRLLRDLGLSPTAPSADPGSGDDLRDRMARLLGSVAIGYARALRDRTLDEQESIRRAAMVAREQAEQALRESESRFRHQATHDPLTDLPNRALFTERLAAAFDRDGGSSRRLGVCFVDLDGFKMVNDTLGHHAGDLLLTSVAAKLRRGVGEHLVARLGGDEFVILVEDTTCTDDVLKVADAALAAINEPTVVDGQELRVSASIGIVERPVAGTTPSEVMRAADITLHWAKTSGKGRWALFDPERNERELTRYALSSAMPAALERGEFCLDYQPLVSLADGRLLGVEALVRWRHPQLGVLRPDKFIGLAEETGLIVRLGGWVLAEACRQARRWVDLSPKAPFVSVNLAVRQVRGQGLVKEVTGLLREHGLPPDRLQLEITESAMMNNADESVDSLRSLADLGVRIAIDDFGTGYSNLSYLRTLPVCELKVAGSFVEGLRAPAAEPASITDERILATLVSLAHTLKLTVTAENVETATQADRLRAIGCDAAQGWHFGAPMPPSHVDALL